MNIWIVTTLLILSLGGIYICRLIILHLIDPDNPSGQQFCKTSGKFDCDRVLKSNLGRINRHIHLADIGLVYFMGQSLLIILEIIGGKSAGVNILFLPSLLAMSMTFVSLFYQALVIRSWCKMCLIVVAIVWLQTSALTANVMMEGQTFGANASSIAFFTLSFLLASVWFFIKSALSKGREAMTAKRKLSLFKKNPNVFRAVLKTQRTVPMEIWDNEFLLGNRHAPTQLIAVINPYCPPCAREYDRLLELLKAHPRSLAVIIRFLVHAGAKTRHTKAVRHLLQEYTHTPPDLQPSILEKWFAGKSLPVTKISNPDADSHAGSGSQPVQQDQINQKHLLQRHNQWWQSNHIKHTPALFINGYEFPGFYSTTDLKDLLPTLAKRPLKIPIMKEKHIDNNLL